MAFMMSRSIGTLLLASFVALAAAKPCGHKDVCLQETVIETGVTTSLASSTTTETVTTTAPTVTTVVFDYYVQRRLRSLGTEALPGYAAAACKSRGSYASACRRIGAEPATTTSTCPLQVETLTITTVTGTVEQTTVVTSTTTATSAPTRTVRRSCNPTGNPFLVRGPLMRDGPESNAHALWMSVTRSTSEVVWADYPDQDMTAEQAASARFVLNRSGYVQPWAPLEGESERRIPCYDRAAMLAAGAASVQIITMPESTFSSDSAAAAGLARVVGCEDFTTGEFSMYAEGERWNTLNCGGKLFQSSGDGAELGLKCVPMVLAVASR
ncbi:hypothetical protein Micbo1qcDRAFT_177857 [Microdochium bolleyi]|uniref:Uncharacterized protein n=1 Tax=Microdochium bolleyi TaxID=196109 RepID=A0A136IV07_9PEZI|nr:hypothetical protein Micbo1qcDRAFT_177857 [Microdochium bolleyi]